MKKQSDATAVRRIGGKADSGKTKRLLEYGSDGERARKRGVNVLVVDGNSYRGKRKSVGE